MALAPPFVLTDVSGRVQRSDVLLADGPLLVVFVERDCPTSVATLTALQGVGGRFVVVSEGTVEAARDLASRTGLAARQVLVEPAPYPVSLAYELRTVPTLVLLGERGDEVARSEGWDREALVGLLEACGGDPGEGFGEALPPTRPGCQARSTFDAQTQESLEAADASLGDDGIEEMWLRGWTDGLPVVPPTKPRVAAMLDGRDPDRELGEVPPKLGRLTVERLAACAVLAGCAPEHFPVVLAATEAVLDPAFNLHGIQNTTHFAAPVLIVNGPVSRRIGMNPGSNALGFGNRANATIGRAVRLMMCLTGGGTPGGLDQSTLGGPHKLTLCFPEHEAASPWEPLHVDRGFDAAVSTVTAFCGEGPAGVSDHYSQTPEALASTLTLAMGNTYAPTWYPVGAETVLVLCPEHAQTFAAAGWSKDRLREWIFTRARRTAGELRATGSGELTPLVAAAESETTEITKFMSPEEVVIVVAGGAAGRFSAVIGPWVGFGLGSAMVSKQIADR